MCLNVKLHYWFSVSLIIFFSCRISSSVSTTVTITPKLPSEITGKTVEEVLIYIMKSRGSPSILCPSLISSQRKNVRGSLSFGSFFLKLLGVLYLFYSCGRK